MAENNLPDIDGLLSGIRRVERTTLIPEPPEALSPELGEPIRTIEDKDSWEAFMDNLRDCPIRCRKPDRMTYYIDKDIVDSIAECDIEKRSGSDIINAILRTFLSIHLEQFDAYRIEKKSLFNNHKKKTDEKAGRMDA